MRKPIILFAALLMTAGYARSMEPDVYNLNANPVASSALVPFSIGYPRGWRVDDDSGPQRVDIYYGLVVAPNPIGPICSFWQTTANRTSHGTTFYSIWSLGDTAAKEAADQYVASMASQSWWKERSLSPVRTSAGDPGWLVESTGYLVSYPPIWLGLSSLVWGKPLDEKKTPIIYHNFFFHAKNKGTIRIEIMTEANNSSWRSEMDQLVLQTLRFNEN